MSLTQRCSPWSEPGAIEPIPVPIAIAHADPGGTSWTTRKSGPALESTSSSKPALLM